MESTAWNPEFRTVFRTEFPDGARPPYLHDHLSYENTCPFESNDFRMPLKNGFGKCSLVVLSANG